MANITDVHTYLMAAPLKDQLQSKKLPSHVNNTTTFQSNTSNDVGIVTTNSVNNKSKDMFSYIRFSYLKNHPHPTYNPLVSMRQNSRRSKSTNTKMDNVVSFKSTSLQNFQFPS